MKIRTKIGLFVAALFGILGLSLTANADPISCPPGQAATLNPSDGGWVCQNNGGNENFSEKPKGEKDKGYFAH